MISKQHRFHGPNSLNFVYRKGQAARSENMSMRYARSRQEDYRLAVVVSKKVSKSAVVRNRIRRRVYEIVRLYRKETGVPLPFDIVLSIFVEQTATIPAEKLEDEVKRLLQRISPA